MSKMFWIDHDIKKSYQDLEKDINQLREVSGLIHEHNEYYVFLRIIHSLINDYPIVLFDGDFSESEFIQLSKGLSHFGRIQKNEDIDYSFAILENLSERLKNWSITLFTSGTTGLPKQITHSFASITKAVKKSDIHKNDIWGFAYNPTHMAGIQVFFQSFLNQNTLVNLFKKSSNDIEDYIKKYKITHISATPTFYRLVLNGKTAFYNVKQISCGGEKLDEILKNKIEKAFPNAKIRNIYASTEIGSLFGSEGDFFVIPNRFKDLVKIEENELIVHKSLLGTSDNLKLNGEWYHTGDIVEIIDNIGELIFKFSHRDNEMINVGGNKVNPNEVETEIMKIPNVTCSQVYGKKNSVLGNILCADIVCENLSEKEVKLYLSNKLQNFKVPRIINFVDEIKTTRTGKMQR